MTDDDLSSPPPAARSWIARVLRLPALVLVAIYFLIDDVVLAAFRPIVAWAADLRIMLRFAVILRHLPPYPTLILFLVPFVVLEPFKLFGLWMMATGRFAPGLATLAVAHVASIVLVERLFHATRDKLLAIGWFAWGYGRVMRLYDWSMGRLRATLAWRQAAAAIVAMRASFRAAIAAIRASRAAAWVRGAMADLRLALIHLRIRLRGR